MHVETYSVPGGTPLNRWGNGSFRIVKQLIPLNGGTRIASGLLFPNSMLFLSQ